MRRALQTGSARGFGPAAASLCLALAACQQPVVGKRIVGATFSPGPKVELVEAWLDLHGHVVATFAVTQADVPLVLDEVEALAPRFTLATLSDHPADGFRAWKSRILTGSQVAAKLPPGGPGTPEAEILTGVRQPGYETPASLVDLGGGRYRYVFANALTDLDPDETVRVGVWLASAPSPTLGTASTFDFRPSGGPAEARETVRDENCGGCHGTLVMHGSRTRVRLCLTCHTWQNSDPDTIDPASMSTTATTDPNPLELGRLVHRIHRGKRLPTLYQSSSQEVPAPQLGAGYDLPVPFSSATSTAAAIVGRKFSVVGYRSHEVVYGRVVQRLDAAQQVSRTVVEGVSFPRDLRDCGVCHNGAAQEAETTNAISRRTCSGCHPDVWFGDATAPISDLSHLAHPGGPRADDSQCMGCHVDPTGFPGAKLYAPISGDSSAHVPLTKSARYNKPVVEILGVENLVPGGQPSVRFRVGDRAGALGPKLNAPDPAYEPDFANSSLVPRGFYSFGIRIAGPTAPDYGSGPTTDPISSLQTDLWALTAVNASGEWAEYVYTFSSAISPDASGTWAVGIDARRRKSAYAHYDKASDTFIWPYTGETVTESPDNVLAYVDTATGTWPPDGPAPRRTIVAEQKCLRCHGRFELHGRQRHQVQYCLFCHMPLKTDHARRPKTSGYVNLGATFDGIEERSIHFKVMVHRIHTGGRTGAASLDGIEPYLVYGYSGPVFFEELFPNDLRNCTLCHEGKSYLVEAVPAGAPPTIANETGTIRHQASTATHSPGESSTLPVQAACLGCHATGATFAHVASKTVGGVETCANCHVKGAVSVEVVHGLAPPTGGGAGSTFSSIVQSVLVPRCATASCHSGNPPVAFPQLDAEAAYAAIVGVTSPEAGIPIVAPGAPENSYLLPKLRGDAGISGQPMPIGDALLDPADVAAIEAWIANGAQND